MSRSGPSAGTVSRVQSETRGWSSVTPLSLGVHSAEGLGGVCPAKEKREVGGECRRLRSVHVALPCGP